MRRWKMMMLVGGLLLSAVGAAPAQAINVFEQCGANSDSKVCKAANSEDEKSATSMVKRIINLLLFGLGVLAVIMIIHGGLKFVTSRGDAANVKSAKDTVLYAVIGLFVALMAYAIVNFVVTSFK